MALHDVATDRETEARPLARRLGGPGEVLGEIAFFSDTGQRAASVRSTAAGRILFLGNGSLRRLAAKHPADGVAIYQALGRVLAHRLGDDAAPASPGSQ